MTARSSSAILVISGLLGFGCPSADKDSAEVGDGDTGAQDSASPEDTTETDSEESASDRDGDGYDEPEDCDDFDAAINPGAAEICNGEDDDCDEEIDEDLELSTWYLDGDEDGYGGSVDTVSCERPAGYADNSSDCDDFDAAINPGATEICNGEDDDCDDSIDGEGICDCDAASYEGHAYLFCDGELSWDDAERACEDSGYGLALVDDEAENSWLAEQGYAFGGGQYFWICANDSEIEGSWACLGQILSYTNWNAGEPNDSYGREDCAVLQPPEAVWNDRDCVGDFDTWYICESS